MSTFLVAREFPIVRQEGDNADIIFTVPIELSLAGTVTAKFQVKTTDSRLIFSKDTTEGITIDGQDITVELLPVDTKGKSGQFRWELEITKEATYGIVTIGKGNFKIVKEIIL